MKFLPKAWLFLCFSLATSTPYAIYVLKTGVYYSNLVRMAYVLLLLGQVGTSIMLTPILMFFLTNIESNKSLVNAVLRHVANDTLDAAIYLEVEEFVQKRQKRHQLLDQMFFGVNILNVLCILITFALRQYYDAYDAIFFGMQYLKESVLTFAVIIGTSSANTMSDKSIELMSSQLLRKCCSEGIRKRRRNSGRRYASKPSDKFGITRHYPRQCYIIHTSCCNINRTY